MNPPMGLVELCLNSIAPRVQYQTSPNSNRNRAGNPDTTESKNNHIMAVGFVEKAPQLCYVTSQN